MLRFSILISDQNVGFHSIMQCNVFAEVKVQMDTETEVHVMNTNEYIDCPDLLP